MSVVSDFFSITKIGRSRFVSYNLLLLVLFLAILDVAEIIQRGSTKGSLVVIVLLMIGALNAKFSIQRIRDTKISTWWSLTWLLPLVYFLWLPILVGFPGSEKKANKSEKNFLFISIGLFVLTVAVHIYVVNKVLV